MFRAAASGPFDNAVGRNFRNIHPAKIKLLITRSTVKATNENLTSEDWAAIMEVCDKVGGDQNGAKEAVQSLIRRLAHRNANVQLYTLEVC